jgi:hypothetical protein
MKYAVSVDGQVFEIEIGYGGRIWINQESHQVDRARWAGAGNILGS